MNKKTMRYLVIAAVAMIILAIVGKSAGWFGQEIEIRVATENVERRTITETITANGKIRPQTEVKISPDVSGEIVELHLKEGNQVERGQLLLRINPETYISMRDRAEAAVNSARAQLANARARMAQVQAQFEQAERNYQRSLRLYEQNTISDSEYETSRSNYQVARAEVEAATQSAQSAEFSVKSAIASLNEAEENLRRTTIYAPTSGTISRLNVEQGERVVGTAQMTGTEMMRIADLTRMEVQVEVNENDIVRVKINDTAVIEVDAYMGQDFRGVVTEIANSANVTAIGSDQITNFDVKILILEESYRHLFDQLPEGRFPFLPGMSATVDIQTTTRRNILTVPIQAVTTRADTLLVARAGERNTDDSASSNSSGRDNLSEVVFVRGAENILEMKKVETGIQDNNYIEIIGGLEEGEEVITAPYSAIARTLRDGSRVKVVDRRELFN
ncbi:MAG: HlyD family efflux transporter periplasmic adaptor subunit [Marinilabiliales bacterium]|nr:MAG: HlyD family efflux transporter periplasmic adaptor subunit [Marinilabiliales bacterium]